MRFLITIVFICVALHVTARSDVFVIMDKHNNELGSLKVVQSEKEGVQKVKVESRVEVKRIITIVLSYTLNSTFKKGRLESNKIFMYQNDQIRDVMTTTKAGNGYMFVKNKKSRQVKDFSFCESMMYYNEPVNQGQIYSEFDGVFKSVKAYKDQHKYELTNPSNNNVSTYWYKDGILNKALVKHALLDLYLYRKE